VPDFRAKMHQKSISAETLPQTPPSVSKFKETLSQRFSTDDELKFATEE